ncbi:MAG: glycoside hydrolase family 3 protein [Actinobacteria bacterium]|nr:glycoside hydrolase family 3 protein [Actinomycetota bacterium]
MKRILTAIIVAALIASAPLAGGCAATSSGGNGGGGGGVDPLQGLTREQKVGQLFLFGFEGTAVTPEIEQWFNQVHPGGVILFARNITDAAQLEKLTGDLQDLADADTGLPLFIAVDQEGGEIVRIDWLGDDVSQSQMADPDQAYRAGLARAQGLKGLGINLNLAPVLDRGESGDFLTQYGRTFPGTPREVGELGESEISGQSDGGILSCAKHFPGYGGITYDPENDRLASVDAVPEVSQFQVAAGADPAFVMTANVIYTQLDPDHPFTLSPAGIAFLEQSVKGNYLIVSDDLASKVLKEAYTLEGTVVQAARAGVDVLLVSGHEAGDTQAAAAAVMQAVESGEFAQEEIDGRVKRVLEVKERISGT